MAEEDLRLQFMKWGARYFVELMLIFGTKSSPGIYDDLAKVILECSRLLAGMPRYLVCQHLDDVLGIGPPGVDSCVWNFFNTYMKEASKVGVRMESPGVNRDKCQEPDTTVLALGVCFCTTTWTWWVREDKLGRILHLLRKIIEAEEDLLGEEMLSLNGRVQDLRFLVRGGRYNVVHFLRAVWPGTLGQIGKKDLVKPSDRLREQALWWSLRLQAAAQRSPIVHPDPVRPSNALQAWTDAAGGSDSQMGAGLGGVFPPHKYFYLPWPAWLNNRRTNNDGVKFHSKLSCLELLGPLVILSIVAEEVRGQHLVCYVDNQGSCDIHRKGYSTRCVYSSTLAKACWDLAEGLGASMTVEKIRRCSDPYSRAADCLSKGKVEEFKCFVPDRNRPERVPEAVITWLKDPREDPRLGSKILLELSDRMEGLTC